MDVSDYVAPNTVLKEVKVALNEAVWSTVGPWYGEVDYFQDGPQRFLD